MGLHGTVTRSPMEHHSTSQYHPLGCGALYKKHTSTRNVALTIKKKSAGVINPCATQVKPVKNQNGTLLIRLQRYNISQRLANFLHSLCCKFRSYANVVEQTCACFVEFVAENEVNRTLFNSEVESVLSERFAC